MRVPPVMTNSFRIDATELLAWHAVLAKRMVLRGVPAIAKEIEAHIARKDADGSVVVTRHQLFTWSEALQGAAARDAGSTLPPVVAEMRSILSGKPVAEVTRDAKVPSMLVGEGPSSGQHAKVSEPARSMYSPPPVQYSRSAATPAQGSVLSGPALADAARQLVRGATRELYVSSPWATGVETIVEDIIALPKEVKVLIVSRRPERDDAAFHQAMDKLGRRRAVTGWSPHIQTRMLIADDARAIVGAAGAPGANSREVGVMITDAATIRELRAAFERAHEEAAGAKY